MLLPALSKAREAARSASCVNKLRQIYYAAFFYAEDSDGYLPSRNNRLLIRKYDGYQTQMHTYWYGPLMRYFGVKTDPLALSRSNSIFLECPSTDMSYVTTRPEVRFLVTYGPTLPHRSSDNPPMINPGSGGWLNYGWHEDRMGDYKPKRMDKIYPNSVILIEKNIYGSSNVVGGLVFTGYDYNAPEYANPADTYNHAWGPAWRHNGGSNFLFLEGNVTHYKRGTLFRNHYWTKQ